MPGANDIQLGLIIHINVPGIISHLVTSKLLLELVRHKAFVVLQVLLDMHLELDDVVQHLLDLGVEFLSQ